MASHASSTLGNTSHSASPAYTGPDNDDHVMSAINALEAARELKEAAKKAEDYAEAMEQKKREEAIVKRMRDVRSAVDDEDTVANEGVRAEGQMPTQVTKGSADATTRQDGAIDSLQSKPLDEESGERYDAPDMQTIDELRKKEQELTDQVNDDNLKRKALEHTIKQTKAWMAKEAEESAHDLRVQEQELEEIEAAELEERQTHRRAEQNLDVATSDAAGRAVEAKRKRIEMELEKERLSMEIQARKALQTETQVRDEEVLRRLQEELQELGKETVRKSQVLQRQIEAERVKKALREARENKEYRDVEAAMEAESAAAREMQDSLDKEIADIRAKREAQEQRMQHDIQSRKQELEQEQNALRKETGHPIRIHVDPGERTPVELGCHSVEDRESCCRRVDGRNNAFNAQPCAPSLDGKIFTSGNTCEPACWIVGACGFGSSGQDEPVDALICDDEAAQPLRNVLGDKLRYELDAVRARKWAAVKKEDFETATLEKERETEIETKLKVLGIDMSAPAAAPIIPARSPRAKAAAASPAPAHSHEHVDRKDSVDTRSSDEPRPEHHRRHRRSGGGRDDDEGDGGGHQHHRTQYAPSSHSHGRRGSGRDFDSPDRTIIPQEMQEEGPPMKENKWGKHHRNRHHRNDDDETISVDDFDAAEDADLSADDVNETDSDGASEDVDDAHIDVGSDDIKETVDDDSQEKGS